MAEYILSDNKELEDFCEHFCETDQEVETIYKAVNYGRISEKAKATLSRGKGHIFPIAMLFLYPVK